MLPFEDRFSRQRRLTEVGEEGQQKLQGHSCCVALTPSGEIAAEYLSRSGVVVTRAEGTPVPAFPFADTFLNLAPRQIAEGAWQALAEIRNCLQLETGNAAR